MWSRGWGNVEGTNCKGAGGIWGLGRGNDKCVHYLGWGDILRVTHAHTHLYKLLKLHTLNVFSQYINVNKNITVSHCQSLWATSIQPCSINPAWQSPTILWSISSMQCQLRPLCWFRTVSLALLPTLPHIWATGTLIQHAQGRLLLTLIILWCIRVWQMVTPST